ncbi:hypothetical protein DL96DRAFT_713169 [Flagelloscypha sp. PMI_526]|nr:hypothetical protein DL96DRAFT_713169 [Flagelloscypha sp. PMI_526]
MLCSGRSRRATWQFLRQFPLRFRSRPSRHKPSYSACLNFSVQKSNRRQRATLKIYSYPASRRDSAPFFFHFWSIMISSRSWSKSCWLLFHRLLAIRLFFFFSCRVFTGSQPLIATITRDVSMELTIFFSRHSEKDTSPHLSTSGNMLHREAQRLFVPHIHRCQQSNRYLDMLGAINSALSFENKQPANKETKPSR